jgi:hypothetical protein
LLACAVAVLLVGLLPHFAALIRHTGPWGTAASWLLDASHQKRNLHPIRLLGVLAAAWLVAKHVSPNAAFLRHRWAAPLTLCGQNSLPVFCVSVLLCFAATIVIEYHPGIVTQIATNAGGLALMVAVAQLNAARIQGRRSRRVASSDAGTPLSVASRATGTPHRGEEPSLTHPAPSRAHAG